MASAAEGDEDRVADTVGEEKGPSSPPTPPPPPLLPGAGSEESTRRGFQKLWADADEIAVLQGFWEFTSRRGTARADYQHDTGPFYDEIRGRLRLDFTRSQLVEKLRRLKKKYRSTASRMAADKGFSFRSPHEEAIFEIASKIWNPVFKRGPADRDNPESCDLDVAEAPKDGALDSDHDSAPRPRRRFKKEKETETAPAPAQTTAATATPPTMPNAEMVEQTMRSCFSPLFNEILYCTGIGHALSPSSLPLNPQPLNSRTTATAVVGEKWKQQHILELEVYLKRLELVHEHIKLKLAELKSKGRS
ncbi:putative transcription factor [Canna indica]|uniref:Transcription factor n=1 Tax=Canna indica TaxID=4628 RepID=A0AAQ3QM52_9LILI|nr:putative transcription factor [Canna indica]